VRQNSLLQFRECSSKRQGKAMLEDGYKRRFNYLRLSVTEICNFRCSYCLPNGYTGGNKKVFLTLAEIKTLARAFALSGTEKIRITGGEPTLRQDIVDIVGICAATPGIKNVALTTNAYRLPDILEQLVDAGLSAVNISADSLDSGNFNAITGFDKLDRVIKSIDLALASGLKKVKINTVLLKQSNAHEFEAFLAFVRNCPVTVRFIELMQTGDNHTYFRKEHLSAKELKLKLLENGWQQAAKSHDAGPAEEFFHNDYRGRIGLIMPYEKNFCDSCNRLRISAQGKLNLCLFASGSHDLRPAIASGDPDFLAAELRHCVNGKEKSHHLEQGYSGGTQNLAMIGG
jgi:cyclic pyranopterin phosphate synthase